jgi:hypothetical protein
MKICVGQGCRSLWVADRKCKCPTAVRIYGGGECWPQLGWNHVSVGGGKGLVGLVFVGQIACMEVIFGVLMLTPQLIPWQVHDWWSRRVSCTRGSKSCVS